MTLDIDAIRITRRSTLRSALERLDASGAGILLLGEEDGRFSRTVTDGDLRRLLLSGAGLDDNLERLPAVQSITLGPDYTRRAALELMQSHAIHHLPVVDQNGKVVELVRRATLDGQVLLSTPHIGDAEMEYVQEAFRTNWIAPLGPNVDAFEKEVAGYVGISHGVALSSGTAAIHLALRLLDVGPGDVVFCSTLTFAASVNPIVYQGAEPVLIDSEPESWNMSPLALERALEEARRENRLPKAVIVVCLYGQSADMDPIIALCDRYGVPVVEDAAESLGAKYKGKASGTFGRIGIYSFNGNKIITTSGGGMLVTENADYAKQAKFLATQARDPAPHYQHSTIGYNYRMSNILAGVGRGQLQVLPARVEARRAVFATYRRLLADLDWLEWMPEPEWSFSTHWLTAATVNPSFRLGAADIVRRLGDEFVEAARTVETDAPAAGLCQEPLLCPRQRIGRRRPVRARHLPAVGSNLSEGDLERVCEAIRRLAP
jgi:dTDP-4-amino-4,6-dideoxygalactose transaminase